MRHKLVRSRRGVDAEERPDRSEARTGRTAERRRRMPAVRPALNE